MGEDAGEPGTGDTAEEIFHGGIDNAGRESLPFMSGGAPVPPFPMWAQSEVALASTARLLRRFQTCTHRRRHNAEKRCRRE